MKGKLKGTTKILLISLLAFTFACDNQLGEDDGTDLQVPTLANIEGRWGINSINVSGSQESLIPCENTITIEPDGSFLFVMTDRGDWGEGTVSYNETDSLLTLDLGSETVNLKLLSLSNGEMTLQSEELSPTGAVTLATNQFVRLDNTSCPSINSSELLDKWSIQSLQLKTFALSHGEKGELLNTELRENIPENKFTLNFRPDDYLNVIDLVTEYDWSFEPFRLLDEYNLVRTVTDDNGETSDHIMHIYGFDAGTLDIGTSQYEVDDNGVQVLLEVRVSARKNDTGIPSITESDLMGKWSARNVTEMLFRNDVLDDREELDNIPNNKITLEFLPENGLQLIDLVDEVGVRTGEFMILDESNILLDTSGDDNSDGTSSTGGHPAEQNQNFDLFHLISNDGQGNVVFKRFEFDNSGSDDFRGELEVRLTKNDGTEAGLEFTDLVGNWQVESVTTLTRNIENSPEVGMRLNYRNDSTGTVTLGGNELYTFDFNFLDKSNIDHTFFESGQSDGDDNLFHLEAASSNQLVVTIFVETQSTDGTADPEMEARWTITLFKTD